MSDLLLWTVIVTIGLCAFGLRFSFIQLAGRVDLPFPIQRALRFVPAATLSAIILPALTFDHHGMLNLSLSNAYLMAGIVAALVAWATRSMLISLMIGMGSVWALQWLLG